MDLKERSRQRLEFLKTVYELTDGDQQSSVNMWEIGQNLGLNRRDTQNVVTWLTNEGLLDSAGISGGISVSHQGVHEVEDALLHPDRETRYFPPVNVIQIGNMVNSQLQQATVSSTQTYTQAPQETLQLRDELEKLKTAIAELDLDEETQEEADVQIQTIETQLKSKKPLSVVIAESAKTLRNLLEGTAAGLIASGIFAMIPQH